jgi:hypothetical protein
VQLTNIATKNMENRMKSQQTCDRCGKTLRAGTMGPDTPVHFDQTGEAICGECMMKMMESISPPVDDNYEVKEFKKRAGNELSRLSGVDISSISLHCKQFISHDVETKIDNNIYDITFIYELIEDTSRWRQARDYMVTWMRQHPLSNKTWTQRNSANTTLVDKGRIVLIFPPENFPEPPFDFGQRIAQQLCPSIDAKKLGWIVYPVNTATEESEKREIGEFLRAWASTQSHPETLKVDMKGLKVQSFPREFTCVIVYRKAKWPF